MKTCLAMDLGGTFIKYGLVTPAGPVLVRDRIPTQPEDGPDAAADRLAEAFRDLLARHADVCPVGLGASVAGIIQSREGVIVTAPNLVGWRNVPLAKMLGDRLGVDVRMANDGDLFALGEWRAGAGRGFRSLVGLTLGTGVGGGLILDGRLWTGAGHSVAEIGHLVVDPNGPLCGCGGRGCLEQYASATAMARMAKEALAAGQPTRYEGDPEKLDAALLNDLARAGDPLARQVFHLAGRALGLGLSDIFNLLGLEAVVIGGGAAPVMEFLMPELLKEFTSRVFAVDPRRVRITRSELGPDAPLVGAAALFESSAGGV